MADGYQTDTTPAQMGSDTKFTYVLIPVDELAPLQEFTADAIMCHDTLAVLLKKDFAGGSLTNMDELRSQYGDKIDEKMGDFQRAADSGVVEMLPLVRNSKNTLPIPSTQTALYFDEMGTLKNKPANKRAFALAKQCGLDLENPLPGDVYVGRVCCDPGPISVSFGKHEMDSSSPWIQQAPVENAEWKGALSNFSDVTNSKAVGAKTADQEEAENLARGWRWTQTESEVEVTVTLPAGTTKSGVNVSIGRSTLRIALKGESAKPLMDVKLFYPVSADDSTWTMGSDARGPHVQVTVEKESEQTWPKIEAKK